MTSSVLLPHGDQRKAIVVMTITKWLPHTREIHPIRAVTFPRLWRLADVLINLPDGMVWLVVPSEPLGECSATDIGDAHEHASRWQPAPPADAWVVIRHGDDPEVRHPTCADCVQPLVTEALHDRAAVWVEIPGTQAMSA